MASEYRLASAKKISFEKIGLALAGLLLLFVFPSLKIIAFSLLMILIGALSLQYQRYVRYFGFELNFFVTVLCSLAYGPVIGAIAGVLSYVIGQMIVGQLSHYSLVTVTGLIACAILCSVLGTMPLPFIIVAMAANIVILSAMGIGWTIMGFPVAETIFTSVVDVAINFLMLSVLGQFFLGMIR